METIKEAWNGILDYLKKQDDISEVAFKVWLSSIEPHTIEDDEVVVFVQTNFQRKIISQHYSAKICDAINHVLGIPLGLKVLSREDIIAGEPAPIIEEAPESGNFFGQKSSDYEYTFENFVVGPSNKFAHAASQAVASKPAGYYNPLFIYGGSGLGKTHLLFAICNEIRKHSPNVKIIYTKGEYIANELIEAIRTNTTPEFRAKYRQVDVLLVDDIQFIAGKVSTQDEFFHTFDALHQANKQIVLTSDRPPKEIATLEERLRTRFEMGLLADIQPPDLETRIAIVKRKAQLLDLNISDAVAEYIASQLKNNVRQLEGAVKRIRAQCLLGGEQPSMLTAQNAIRDIKNDSQPVPVTVERIISEVARTLNVTPEDIRSSKRTAQISKARQVAIYVVREITGLPMKSIGTEFGTRDHSTVVYAIQKVEALMQKDSSYKGMIMDIIKNISGK
ncbi:MAG TPA: chromosomal replication initiator protein DnaA [Candidatus Avimonas sp.]|nr:chromosomal replication initiator protein DnaA [Clostridiales bacterium]HPU58535.1 chromosomal replication initiator protein DnaA [Candidatus Avimonas sp.]